MLIASARLSGCWTIPILTRAGESVKGSISDELGLHYHGVRYRTTGYREIIEVRLLFPHETPVGEARRLATLLEERLPAELGKPTEVITHLESLEGHEHVLAREHSTGRPSRDAIAGS